MSKSAKLQPIVAKTMSSPASLRLVFETLALVVAVEPVAVPGVLLAEQAADDVFQGEVVRSGEDVDPAVVVVVQRPAGEAREWPVDAQLVAHVLERAVAVVPVEPAFSRQVVQEQVGKAVVVKVEPGAALAEFLDLFVDAGRWRRLPRTCRCRDCGTAGWAAARRRRTGRPSRRCRSRPRRPRWN